MGKEEIKKKIASPPLNFLLAKLDYLCVLPLIANVKLMNANGIAMGLQWIAKRLQ